MGHRKLSYAGRATFVNTVLITLHTYWSAIFLLPENAIKKIEGVCRNYLWTGLVDYQKAPLVAWKKLCNTKEEGGLGIRDIRVWNKAAIAKLVDWIYNQPERLWVKWVHSIYIRGKAWQQYQPPYEAAWYWKQICKIKGKFADGFQDGKWIARNTGYNIRSGYDWCREEMPECNWHRTVWCNWNIPKHMMIAWLAQQQALNVKAKLHRLGCCPEDLCVLCWNNSETHEHLFFQCAYSRKVMEQVSSWCHITVPTTNPIQMLMRQARTKLQRKMLSLMITTCWYYIWWQRNECRLKAELKLPAQLAKEIITIVRNRINSKIKHPLSVKDKSWMCKLDH